MAIPDLHRKKLHMSIKVLYDYLFLEMTNFFCHLGDPTYEMGLMVAGF